MSIEHSPVRAKDDDKAPRPNSVDAFCKEEGFGRSFVYEEIRAGRLIAKKAGGKTLILPEERKRYFASLPVKEPRNPTD